MDDTKASNCQLETANAELKTEIEELKRINQSLLRDMEEQRTECTLRLQKQLANHQRVSRQLLEKLSTVKDSKRTMLQIHEMEIKKMRQAHKEEITYLSTKIEDTKHDYETNRDQRGKLEARLTDVNHENNVLSSELSEVRTALNENISESTLAANAANRKIEHLTAIQSEMMSSVRELELTKERFRNLTRAIDSVLSLSKKDMVEEVGPHPGQCADDMQFRLIAIQNLANRIAYLHKSRQIQRDKLKRVDRFWRNKANEYRHKIDDLEQQKSSIKEDLEMFGWNEDDSKAIVAKKAKSLRTVAAELRCVQLQQHVEALRVSIEKNVNEISKLRGNLRISEHEVAETRRLHCSGVLLLSNQLMLMGGPSSPKSMIIVEELRNMPHHSHFDWKALPPPEIDLEKVTDERFDSEKKTLYLGQLEIREQALPLSDVDEQTFTTESPGSAISIRSASQNGEEASPTIMHMQKGFDLKVEITDSFIQLPLDVVDVN